MVECIQSQFPPRLPRGANQCSVPSSSRHPAILAYQRPRQYAECIAGAEFGMRLLQLIGDVTRFCQQSLGADTAELLSSVSVSQMYINQKITTCLTNSTNFNAIVSLRIRHYTYQDQNTVKT